MKRAMIAEWRHNLSRDLDDVGAGGTVLVPRPLPRAARPDLAEAGRASLERRGMIRRGTGGLPAWLGRGRPPRLRGSESAVRCCDASALALLVLAERHTARVTAQREGFRVPSAG